MEIFCKQIINTLWFIPTTEKFSAFKTTKEQTYKMAQQIQGLTSKPEDLNLIPGIHMMDSQRSLTLPWAHTHTHTIQKYKKTKIMRRNCTITVMKNPLKRIISWSGSRGRTESLDSPLCSQGWPWTPDLLISTFCVLGLQVCVIISSLCSSGTWIQHLMQTRQVLYQLPQP